MNEQELAMKEVRKDLAAVIAMLHVGKYEDAYNTLLCNVQVVERQIRLDRIAKQREKK